MILIQLPQGSFVERFCLLLALAGGIFYCSRLAWAQGNTKIVSLPAGSSAMDIQQALDQLPADGEVRLVDGIYTVREPIMLRREHQTLRGSGDMTILQLADHANCPVVILGSPVNASLHPIAEVTLADLVIDGNRENQDRELWRLALDNSQLNNNGICIWETVEARVEGVVCCHCRSGGLVTSSGTRRLVVKNFESFDNEFDGLACYRTEDSRFSGLELHDNKSAGISVDLRFNHNVIEDALLSDNDLGIFMRESRSNVFDRVTVMRSRNHGVFVAATGITGVSGWQLSPGTECSSNVFVNLTVSESGGYGFWLKDPDCTNNVLMKRSFSKNAKGDFALMDPRLLRVQ